MRNMRMLMPENRSEKDGRHLDGDTRLTELHDDLRALYEMYRREDLPERVVRLVHQLEDAYWDARLAENGAEKGAGAAKPTPRNNSN